jgi:hypothetical protein
LGALSFAGERTQGPGTVNHLHYLVDSPTNNPQGISEDEGSMVLMKVTVNPRERTMLP